MSNALGFLNLLCISWLLYMLAEWMGKEEPEPEEPEIIVKKYKKVIEVVPKEKK